MKKENLKHINIQEELISDDDPIWQNILHSPKFNELFHGIHQAEKDIQNGEKGKDFDMFFEEFDRIHFNGNLFQASNS